MIKKKIVFLCSPHIGALDNWLPIILELNNRYKNDLEFICILSKTNWLNSEVLDSALIQLSNKIFDKIILKNKFGDWVYFEDFSEAESVIRGLNNNNLIKFSSKVKNLSVLRPIGVLFKKTIEFALRRKHSLNRVNWKRTFKGATCLLYDLGQERKYSNSPFIKELPKIPKFSIFHGLITKPNSLTDNQVGSKHSLHNGRAYLFSEIEVPYYMHKYGLSKDDIKVTGIPRHQSGWVDLLMKHQPLDEIPFKNYVLIISRPSGSGILPRDRMKSSLELIKKEIVEKLGYPIVIKTHPSEKNKDLYKEVFYKERYNKDWIFSETHPLISGLKSEFAISFCSGVSVDLVSQGVPVIEILNLRGLQEFDNEHSLRDSNGDPVLRYRFYNLLLGASDEDQFKKHLKKINSNYKVTKKELSNNYKNIYQNKADIADYIANDIAFRSGISS